MSETAHTAHTRPAVRAFAEGLAGTATEAAKRRRSAETGVRFSGFEPAVREPADAPRVRVAAGRAGA